MAKLTPGINRILVIQETGPSKSKGGLMLPSESKKYSKGTIVGIGQCTDFDRNQLDFSVNDTVLFNEYGTIEFEVDGNTYKSVSINEIYVIL